MLISENFFEVKVDKDGMDERMYGLGETEPYEPYTQDIKRLFKDMQKEYGRCTGSVFIDTADGKVKRIGWVFRKWMMYEDARTKADKYIREVWVTLHDDKPTKTIQHHYHELN